MVDSKPPQQWSDLGWRDKLRLRQPDLLGLIALLAVAGACAMRVWWT